ncbi:MAG: cation diffusion facilitator family transporter [Bdellovibrionales bacterium]
MSKGHTNKSEGGMTLHQKEHNALQKMKTHDLGRYKSQTKNMQHDHSHTHSAHGHHHHHGGSVKRIKTALWLNMAFTVIEIIGGLWSGSVAVLADAVHDFGDSLSLGLALYLEKRSETGPTTNFSYGLKRLSLLSAAITGFVLITGSIFIGVEAVQRLLSGDHEPFGLGMMGMAVIGLSVNGLAAWRLMSGHTHNEKMLSWHLIEDVMGWAAVLIGSFFIHFAGWAWLDPVLALMISGFVGYNAIRNLLQVTLVFLQRMPHGLNRDTLKSELRTIAGVQDIHDLHAWTLDGERHVISMHAVLAVSADAAKVKREIRHLAGHHGSVHTTIETESAQEACVENCDDKHTH